MAERQNAEHSLLITTLVLRRVVGILGMALPFILALGYPVFCDGSGVQGSGSGECILQLGLAAKMRGL